MSLPHKIDPGAQIFSWIPYLNAPFKSTKGCSWVQQVESRAAPGDHLPEGAKVIFRVGMHDGDEVVLFRLESASTVIFFVTKGIKNALMVGGYSLNPDRYLFVRSMVNEIAASYPLYRDEKTHLVDVKFWRMSETGPAGTVRKLDAPTWSQVDTNYPGSARPHLAELANMTRETLENRTGKLVILHGPPGTGKTTFLRSLARQWADWATLHYITDPDAFLHSASYLWETVMDEDERWDPDFGEYVPTQKVAVLIMEDVDELIVGDAKAKQGQAFSRLLNLGDGFIGQGLNLVVILTTNEPVSKLAPALVRPGRALAQIEVPAFSRAEAHEWLGSAPLGDSPYTLASLYSQRSEVERIVNEAESVAYGNYI